MKPEHGFLLSIGVLCTIGVIILLSILLPPTGQFRLIMYLTGGIIITVMLTTAKVKTKKQNLEKK